MIWICRITADLVGIGIIVDSIEGNDDISIISFIYINIEIAYQLIAMVT